MKTATWVASTSAFRPEFVQPILAAVENLGLDVMIQPIDAPDVFSAGYSKKAVSVDGSYEYDIPVGIVR